DGGGGHAADVERRELDRFLKVAANAFCGLDAGAPADGGVVIAGIREDFLLRVGERDPVVVAGDGDAAVVVLHGGDQPRETHRGVGNVVAEVATVQGLPGTVDDEGDARDAAV